MERLLARLELRYGRFALPAFTYYLVAIQAFVFVVELTHPGFSQVLALDWDLVLHGQLWRLFTYLVIPPTTSPIWVLFSLYWLHTMGTQFEALWGPFKYQLYWLSGMLLTTIGAAAFHVPATNTYLLMSLFLAFATNWPDFKIRVFLVIPVAVKWLALVDALALLAAVGTAHGGARVLPLLATGNYLLFFTPALIDMVRGGARRAERIKAQANFRRGSERAVSANRQCTRCGVTNADPAVEFRVCTCERCAAPTEFCLAHARDH